MKLLVAIKSCMADRDRGAHQLVRDTWGQDVKDAHLRFFVGAGSLEMLKNDEVRLDCADGYPDLPFKTREIVRYTLENGYDYAFLCDTGSFVIPHHLMAYDFDKYDYMGYWGLSPKPIYFEAQDMARGCRPVIIRKCYPWASGGGYILSRKAMEIVANNEPVVWAEDCSTGQLLAQNGILLEDRAHDGYNGYIVTWIHGEKNEAPNAMERRCAWMETKYKRAKEICATEGCSGPSWDRKPRQRIFEPCKEKS